MPSSRSKKASPARGAPRIRRLLRRWRHCLRRRVRKWGRFQSYLLFCETVLDDRVPSDTNHCDPHALDIATARRDGEYGPIGRLLSDASHEEQLGATAPGPYAAPTLFRRAVDRCKSKVPIRIKLLPTSVALR